MAEAFNLVDCRHLEVNKVSQTLLISLLSETLKAMAQLNAKLRFLLGESKAVMFESWKALC
jgi:hypothetical protein